MNLGELKVWEFIADKLKGRSQCVLLLVTSHQGSSPGRTGFKMAVDQSGAMEGSIGGGIMEHKLVELAKKLIVTKKDARIKHQVHRADAPSDRSGMICSGDQYVSLIPLASEHLPLVESICKHLKEYSPLPLEAGPHGLSVGSEIMSQPFDFEYESEHRWRYRERLGYKYFLHIVGGGHISLALSELAVSLDFHVSVYDDRKDLHTLELNSFAHAKHATPYYRLNRIIKPGGQQYVVIMTFGYRSDKVALKNLINYDFAYLGLLGSVSKTQELLAVLAEEGYSQERLRGVDAPAGVKIKSQTPREIAVSIAARLIAMKNR